MFKKSLLASIAFINLSPAQASGAEPAHCPPCPCNTVDGWVLIPAGGGAPCSQGVKVQTAQAAQMGQSMAKGNLHPPRTPEQEALAQQLKGVRPHIYLRANPNSVNPTKKEGEWGKALNGKVYFKVLGNWVDDPSVDPAKDKVTTNFQEKKGVFEALFGSQKSQQSSRSSVTARSAQARQANAQAGSATQAGANAQARANAQAAAQAQEQANSAAAGTGAPPLPPRNQNAAPSPQTASATVNGWTKVNGKWVENAQTQYPVLTAPHATSDQGVRGPATHNPAIPGAPGTPETDLDTVNGQVD